RKTKLNRAYGFLNRQNPGCFPTAPNLEIQLMLLKKMQSTQMFCVRPGINFLRWQVSMPLAGCCWPVRNGCRLSSGCSCLLQVGPAHSSIGCFESRTHDLVDSRPLPKFCDPIMYTNRPGDYRIPTFRGKHTLSSSSKTQMPTWR